MAWLGLNCDAFLPFSRLGAKRLRNCGKFCLGVSENLYGLYRFLNSVIQMQRSRDQGGGGAQPTEARRVLGRSSMPRELWIYIGYSS